MLRTATVSINDGCAAAAHSVYQPPNGPLVDGVHSRVRAAAISERFVGGLGPFLMAFPIVAHCVQ